MSWNPLPKPLIRIAAALAALTLPLTAGAATPAQKGLAIATEMDRRDEGWGDSEVSLEMVLGNRQGETSTRELRIRSLEVSEPELGDRSLTVFDRPRDIKGTALLSHTRVLEADDQWLYLPALKRVKRISSSNKSGPFVGSEFAYEDLLSQEVAKYTYKWLRDEACAPGNTLTCFVVERYPQYKNSGYTKQIVWIDQQEYRPMRIDYFDRKDALLKTLRMTQYRQYLGQYWRAHHWRMENLQTGKTTDLVFSDFGFRLGLNENAFSSSRLKRVR